MNGSSPLASSRLTSAELSILYLMLPLTNYVPPSCTPVSGLQTSIYVDHASVGNIQVTRGVRQGASLSPLLCVIGSWFILHDLFASWERCCHGCRLDLAVLHYLIYADDILIAASSPAELVANCQQLQERLRLHGMQVSLPKLEILINDAWIDNNGKQFTGLDTIMTFASSMVYLGTVLNAFGRATPAVDRAIVRGWIGSPSSYMT
eukprot:268271-Amphidinium_carterae.1